MKKIYTYSVFTVLLMIGVFVPESASANITVTCYDSPCTPTYSNHIGTVTLVLACNATSPASFTGQLTVNGVSTPVHTQNCSVPTITFTADPTIVNDGVQSTLTWTVTDAPGGCTASGAPDWNRTVASSGTNNAPVSPSSNTTYTLTCMGVNGPTARQATVRVPSGDIAGTPCEIAVSGASCPSLITWASADFLGTPEVSQGGVQFSNEPSNPGTPRPVSIDNRTFTLQDSVGTFSDSFPVVVTCASGSVWAGGACLPLPVITLQASPNLIRSGSTAEVEVSIDSEFDLTCTMTGGMQETFTHTGSPTTGDYTRDTRGLTSAQIVQIECIADAYPVVRATAQERIDVIPTVQEI